MEVCPEKQADMSSSLERSGLNEKSNLDQPSDATNPDKEKDEISMFKGLVSVNVFGETETLKKKTPSLRSKVTSLLSTKVSVKTRKDRVRQAYDGWDGLHDNLSKTMDSLDINMGTHMTDDELEDNGGLDEEGCRRVEIAVKKKLEGFVESSTAVSTSVGQRVKLLTELNEWYTDQAKNFSETLERGESNMKVTQELTEADTSDFKNRMLDAKHFSLRLRENKLRGIKQKTLKRIDDFDRQLEHVDEILTRRKVRRQMKANGNHFPLNSIGWLHLFRSKIFGVDRN